MKSWTKERPPSGGPFAALYISVLLTGHYTGAMHASLAVQNSVGNITAMVACCGAIFGILVFRLLPKVLPAVSDSPAPKDQLLMSVKMIALFMVVPVVSFLFAVFGEFSILWHAFPAWCLSIGFLVILLACLIFSLFWLDQEDPGDDTIESDLRPQIDTKLKKKDAERKIVFVGLGFWMLCLCASYVWLLHLASISFRDVLHWF